MLGYNLVHTVMLEAARRQKTTPDRISFIDTVRWLLSAEPGEALPDLLINPSRPDRHGASRCQGPAGQLSLSQQALLAPSYAKLSARTRKR